MKTPDDLSSAPTPLEHEAYGWVVRFVSGEAGPEDIKALQAWSAQSPDHAAAFDRASKAWRAAEPVVRKLSTVRRAISIGSSAPARVDTGRRAILAGALAASAAGMAFMVAQPPLGLWPSWAELTADYRTETGQQRQVMLSGDVAIDMNTQTSIALISTGKVGDGIALIAGEAMISVPPTMPSRLVVLAADGRVIAADARFNVRRDGRSVCVTCVRGQVEVEYGPARRQLPAGRQVTYSEQGLHQPAAIDPGRVTAWQEGIVVFDATPIAKVVEEVNRYRAGRVILTSAALGQERFSARFRIANIDGIVDQIAQVFNAKVRTLPGGVVLLG
jgi:transmembrane sensor